MKHWFLDTNVTIDFPTHRGIFTIASFAIMVLRERIIHDVNSIADLQLLNQLFDYMQVIKRNIGQVTSNRDAVLRFANTISDAGAAALSQSLTQEYGQIEGEW